jgi:transcriptional regulator with XRE-family HTH domain
MRPGVANTDPKLLLALRLRALREEHWPDRRITQPQLARALGVSVPLISSWESPTSPRIPPLERLNNYAKLFATPRSFDQEPGRPLAPQDMTDEERQSMGQLREELTRLRRAAMGADANSANLSKIARGTESSNAGPWCFDDGGDITIVCAQLPEEMLTQIPYTNVDNPDYIELLTFSDLDSLFEIYGRLSAVNPVSKISRQVAEKLTPDDYTSHLITLGGIDWNELTSSALRDLQLPVQQVADWDSEGGQYFEVHDSGTRIQHKPILEKVRGQTILREDVALFARAVNPFNQETTISICTGMYGRGGCGAVRALTDVKFRDRNAAYLQSRFGDSSAYCILMRVPIANGRALTPDWTRGDYTLFEWSAKRSTD